MRVGERSGTVGGAHYRKRWETAGFSKHNAFRTKHTIPVSLSVVPRRPFFVVFCGQSSLSKVRSEFPFWTLRLKLLFALQYEAVM
jgi:hypothetical protein